MGKRRAALFGVALAFLYVLLPEGGKGLFQQVVEGTTELSVLGCFFVAGGFVVVMERLTLWTFTTIATIVTTTVTAVITAT
jgi:hypothetical protein